MCVSVEKSNLRLHVQFCMVLAYTLETCMMSNGNSVIIEH